MFCAKSSTIFTPFSLQCIIYILVALHNLVQPELQSMKLMLQLDILIILTLDNFSNYCQGQSKVGTKTSVPSKKKRNTVKYKFHLKATVSVKKCLHEICLPRQSAFYLVCKNVCKRLNLVVAGYCVTVIDQGLVNCLVASSTLASRKEQQLQPDLCFCPC